MDSESALSQFLNLLSLLSQQRSLEVSRFWAGQCACVFGITVWLLVGPQSVPLLTTGILALLLCMLFAERAQDS